MTTSTHLLHRKRFLPLFCTQLLNAFNDNLYKTAMVLFVVYQLYNDESQEGIFSAVATVFQNGTKCPRGTWDSQNPKKTVSYSASGSHWKISATR